MCLDSETDFSLRAGPPEMRVGGPQLDGGMKGMLALSK